MDHRSRALLLKIARQALLSAVGGKAPEPPPKDDLGDPELLAERGAFVSLHRSADDSIRGCVGCMSSTTPLVDLIAEMTRAAALRDPRFPPVRADEIDDLELEISVLGPTERIQSLDEVEIGRDGLLVVGRGRRGVLLPQVAEERGWDAKTFAAQTCVKAGLDARDSTAPDVEFYKFFAEVFSEQTEALVRA